MLGVYLSTTRYKLEVNILLADFITDAVFITWNLVIKLNFQ